MGQAGYRVVAATAHDVVRRDVARVLQPGGLQQFAQGLQRFRMKVVDALGFVAHHQRVLADRVLRGDAGGAVAGVAGLGLQAAQREHEAARAVAPVGPQGQHAGHIKGGDHLAGATDFDAVAQARPAQRVVHQGEPFLQRRAHVVGELHGRGTRAALGAVNHDEIRRDAGLEHGFDDAKPFPVLAYAQLESGGLAAG